jgi:hypothetical protein
MVVKSAYEEVMYVSRTATRYRYQYQVPGEQGGSDQFGTSTKISNTQKVR